jgi:4-diphosphocytidyl-2-C-methyl-D-erythritol kinase
MTARALVLRPPAKINLSLQVRSVRPDGYHDLHTLFQSIALSDRLSLTLRKGPLALESDSERAPGDSTNLVWRAAVLLWQTMGRRGAPEGVAMRLRKRIPVAAGLGGGSADAAAALAGLHALWNGRLARVELLQLAAELGSDVPFFLVGGTALGLGRGERLYPMAEVPRLSLILIVPSFGISTGDAYRWLDEDRASVGSPRPGVDSADCLDLGWPTGPVPVVNDLQASVIRRQTGISEALRALDATGARASAISGSGSAAFGVFPAGAIARAARRLQRSDWQVIVTRTLSRREALTRIGLREP